MRSWTRFGLIAAVLSLCPATRASAHDSGGDDRADAQERLAELGRFGRIDTTWRIARDHAVARAIDPDDYECGPTDFDTWIDGKFGAIEDFGAFLDIYFLGVLDWSTYYTFLFDHDASDDTMGVDGEQTKEMVKRFKDLKGFWDIQSDDILLQGMHGAVLADDAKMVPVVQFFLDYGFIVAPAGWTAQDIVDYAQGVITSDAGLGYDNPLFTLNAFAVTADGEPAGSPFYGVPDKIVMGDGISEALADLGLGTNAPDQVIAHEFGHHVQFELGVYDAYDGTPEFTRRTELMADAFGAYYCAHSRGASFQTKRLVDVYAASYAIGDCAFDNPGHHGTPNQREAAAEWGAGVATSAKKQGHVNSAATMLSLFDDELPDLIAPDAE